MTSRTPRMESLQTEGPQAGERARVCDHPDCGAAGDYRAPVSRDRLNEYLWFCLEHVRAYNAAWDYHRDMDPQDIEADRLKAYTWDRPTWRVGSGAADLRDAEAAARAQAEELAGRRRRQRQRHRAGDRSEQAEAQPVSDRDRALEAMGLSAPVTWAAIRKRYRELVKSLHPDTNGGDKVAENRMKAVNEAYSILKALYL
ncbi:MAG: J domain-containing protein [Pseudomonadota bacterium]